MGPADRDPASTAADRRCGAAEVTRAQGASMPDRRSAFRWLDFRP
jgi:hypothetical protein